jgi:hypothetical protein
VVRFPSLSATTAAATTATATAAGISNSRGLLHHALEKSAISLSTFLTFRVTTTPVPTDPPPQNKKSCTLIPGRLERDVLAYNRAASEVTKGLGVCDMHKVITDHCGVGYSSCDIAQCGGPHFPGRGFVMLGEAMARCVTAA